jgi:hypothetical protein
MSNNTLLFNAAYASAFGGIHTSRWITSGNAADYTIARNQAITFAQAVDAAIPTDSAVTEQHAALLASICQQVLSGKGSPGQPAPASAIAAAYNLVSASVLPLGDELTRDLRQWSTITTSGPSLSNTTALLTLLPASVAPPLSRTFPPNYFNAIGQSLLIEGAGNIGVSGLASPCAFTLHFRLGGITVALSASIFSNNTSKSNLGWNFRWLLRLAAVGAAARFINAGFEISEGFRGGPSPSASGQGAFNTPLTAPVAGAPFDATIANQFDFLSQMSSAFVANSIQMRIFRILA